MARNDDSQLGGCNATRNKLHLGGLNMAAVARGSGAGRDGDCGSGSSGSLLRPQFTDRSAQVEPVPHPALATVLLDKTPLILGYGLLE